MAKQHDAVAKALHALGKTSREVAGNPPKAVERFIDAFDAGKYPELIA